MSILNTDKRNQFSAKVMFPYRGHAEPTTEMQPSLSISTSSRGYSNPMATETVEQSRSNHIHDLIVNLYQLFDTSGTTVLWNSTPGQTLFLTTLHP